MIWLHNSSIKVSKVGSSSVATQTLGFVLRTISDFHVFVFAHRVFSGLVFLGPCHQPYSKMGMAHLHNGAANTRGRAHGAK